VLAVEQANLMAELRFQAQHDFLTGLANRPVLEDRLLSTVAAAATAGRSAALLSINLDRFKLVNDVLGHRTGDLLLRQVAVRLAQVIRPTDTLARSGGDEFVLLVPDAPGREAILALGRRLLETFDAPFHIDGHELFVAASVGISVFPDNAGDAAALERTADSAMRQAKRRGRNGCVVYDPASDAALPERLEMERHLRRAAARGELTLHYQPQVDANSGRLIGAEALLRWNHASLGLVSPARFIPIAEETGMIAEFGRWVLNQACTQAGRWRHAGRRLRLAVNVSAIEFEQTGFVDGVERALCVHGIDPALLELELTESAVVNNIDLAVTQLARLRGLGMRIAIDDFGTGHSSLGYLQRLPVDTIKIDRSFVAEIRTATSRPPLVQSVISLAHALGLTVVAEGVETEAQLAALQCMECDEIQGYLIAKPLPAPEFDRWADTVAVAGV
jgi:diguanylate cyclase (GGDEF)-like protein